MNKKMVLIEWDDAHSTASWLTDGEMEDYFEERAYGVSRSIGWLIKKDKNWLMIAGRLGSEIGDSEMSYGMLQKIPRKWISRITEIKQNKEVSK